MELINKIGLGYVPKLGLKPPVKDRRTLHFANFYTPAPDLPPIPETINWSKVVSDYGMMCNDTIGDCGIAGPGHAVQTWTANIGKEFVAADSDIIKSYSDVSGFNPTTLANDNGVVLLDVLKYLTNTGIAGHKIQYYLSIDPTNVSHMKAAAYIFGGVLMGLNLPLSAQGQTLWQMGNGVSGVNAPGSWGGHCTYVPDVDDSGATHITWGIRQPSKWDWMVTYSGEAWAMISEDWINANSLSPSGIDIAAIQKCAAELRA